MMTSNTFLLYYCDGDYTIYIYQQTVVKKSKKSAMNSEASPKRIVVIREYCKEEELLLMNAYLIA